MVRVTLDTNVIISALNFSGNPRRILVMARSGELKLTVSDAILNETAGVLRRPKFGWPEEAIRKALGEIAGFAEHVEPKQRIDIVQDDPTDNRIIECAAASGSEYLVTGDKHLLNIGQYLGVKIVTPSDFVEMQAERAR